MKKVQGTGYKGQVPVVVLAVLIERDFVNDQINEVELLMGYSQGKPQYENVPAEKIGVKRYRILSSPGFAPGVATGDEIEMDPSEKVGYRVIKRSGNVCIQLFLFSYDENEKALMAEKMYRIGGWLEGGSGDGKGASLLIFCVHVDAGFGVIQEVMGQIVKEFKVDQWMYGNVYDTKDGVTPLNWWNK